MAIPYGSAPFLICLNREWQQGLVDRNLYEEFRERWASQVHGGPNAMNPSARADQIIRDMHAMAKEERRRALLQWSATRRIAEAMRSYVNRKGMPDAGEFATELLYSTRSRDSSLAGRADSMFVTLMADFNDAFLRFRKSDLTGMQRHLAELHDVVRELAGQNTGNAAARTFALAWQQVNEQARRLFNAAGGNIPKIDKWIMTQMHNAAKVERAGFDAWRAFITPLLDVAAMIDGRTGLPLNPADLDDALRHVYNSITLEGLGANEASMRGGGQGGIALQRLEHRFLIFRDADGWLAYQRRFASGTLIDTMLSHLRGMAKDIAAMQELGPNPQLTIDWLAQTIEREGRLAADGDPNAIFPSANDIGVPFNRLPFPNAMRRQYAKDKVGMLKSMWDVYTGAAHAGGNQGFANGIGTAKNVFLSNALGATTILAQTDHVTSAIARAHAGLPVWRGLSDYYRAVSWGGREESLEIGIFSESAANTFMTETRMMGPIFGKTWSRWLLERNMTFSALKPHTAALKNAFGLSAFRQLAIEANTAWADLDPGFRDFMGRYGLTEPDWDAIRFTPTRTTQRGLEIIHHQDIARAGGNAPPPAVRPRAGLTPREELAMRVLEMVRQETERAVPSGNLRTERHTAAAPGTFMGFAKTSIMSLKSYTISAQQQHIYRMFELLHRQGLRAGGLYAAMFVVGLSTFMVPVIMANDKRKGLTSRDPFSWDVWQEAIIKSGGLGMFSDVFLYGQNEDGKDLVNAFGGPLLDMTAQAFNAGRSTIDWLRDEVTGEEHDTNPGRDNLRLLKKIMPFSTLWYASLAIDRKIYDALQRALDPDAEDAIDRKIQWYEENKKQGFWWGPGQADPDWERFGK